VVRKSGVGSRGGSRQPPKGAERSRLAELKRAIERGEYETPEKLELALRNLLADLRKVGPTVGASRGDETGGELP